MRRLARLYGDSPVHLLAHLVLLPLAVWAVLTYADFRGAGAALVWFIGALIAHDLVLLPFYSVLDRVVVKARLRGIRVVNFVRAPAFVSASLFLAFAPMILREGYSTLAFVSGREPEGYTTRWLLATAILFGLSALALAVQVLRAKPLPTPVGGAQLDAVRGW